MIKDEKEARGRVIGATIIKYVGKQAWFGKYVGQ